MKQFTAEEDQHDTFVMQNKWLCEELKAVTLTGNVTKRQEILVRMKQFIDELAAYQANRRGKV